LDEIKNERARNKIASETQVANYVHGIPRYTALGACRITPISFLNLEPAPTGTADSY
jgi:hypothetical protein